MRYILALDQGTTSSRALVFDENGRIVASAQQEFPQLYPRPGWVEHDPEQIWQSQHEVAQQALSSPQIDRPSVAALGITNQRETTLVWDRTTGKPVHNAIVWQDRRTAPICEQLMRDGVEDEVRQRTGLLLDPYFSASKLHWLLENVDGVRRRAESGQLLFGTVDSWLIWNLTGGARHVTDATNASRTLLYNIHTRQWDPELLRIFRVPAGMLAEVRGSSEVVGEAFGGMPIGGLAGDQQAALFGQACVTPGLAKNTYGTGCFLLQNTGSHAVPSRNRLLTTVASAIKGEFHYALEGAVFTGGAVVQWLRDGLGLIRSANEIEALANSVTDNGGVYLVPAFTGLGAPHWDPHARGTLAGITRGTTSAHLARAALESIALQVADLMNAMSADSGLPVAELRVDGGAAVNNTLLQLQADLLGIPVIRPATTETTALGAAYLAGLAVGLWRDPSEVNARWRVDRRFEPQMSAGRAEELRGSWRRAVERAKNWATT